MGRPRRRVSFAELLHRLLDAPFTMAVQPVLGAIARNSTGGIMARRIQELTDEAERLDTEGEPLNLNNPIFRAFMADFEDAQQGNRALLNGISDDVLLLGIGAAGLLVLQGAFTGRTAEQVQRMGYPWQVVPNDTLLAALDYMTRPAWVAKLSAFGEGVPDLVRGIAERGIAAGWGPRRIAAAITQAVETMPASYAQQLMRTLQLTSLRDAQVLHRVANAGILEYQIRIAALDDRTCMACIALHGTQLPIDVRIDDHHRGRCTSITKVRGLPLQQITPGPEWFAAQSPERQRAIAGPSKLAALEAGAIQWPDLVKPYTDDLFGPMVQEASLVGLLGEQAQEYYAYAG